MPDEEVLFQQQVHELTSRVCETESAVNGLCQRIESSDKINRTRIAEVHKKIDETREQMTGFQTETRLSYLKQDENFRKLEDKLTPIIDTHQALAALPRIIKWAAVILGSISTIIGAAIAIFIYLQTLAQAAAGT